MDHHADLLDDLGYHLALADDRIGLLVQLIEQHPEHRAELVDIVVWLTIDELLYPDPDEL
jgi:hypothetical protein